MSEGRPAQAVTLCQRVLAGTPSQVEAAEATRILGLAEIEAGNRKEDLRNCEAAVVMAGRLADMSITVAAALALAEARLANRDASGALSIIRNGEPSLVTLLDSRWRALGLAARAEPGEARQYTAEAKQQLDAIARQSGTEAFTVYLKRLDLQELLRPISRFFPAIH